MLFAVHKRVNIKMIRVCTCTDFVQGPNGILYNIILNPKYGFLNNIFRVNFLLIDKD